MGDVRFARILARLQRADSAIDEIRSLDDEAVVAALAAASRAGDPYLANVLATEAMNRVRTKNLVAGTIADAVLAVDEECNVAFVNPAAEALVGAPPEAIVGRPLGDLLRARGRGADWDRAGVLAVTDEVRHDVPAWLRKADGTALPVEATVAPVAREGDVAGSVVVVRDVSQRMRTERRRAARLGVAQLLSEPVAPDSVWDRLCAVLIDSVEFPAAQAWVRDGDVLRLVASRGAPTPFREASAKKAFRPGEGLPGSVWADMAVVWMEDVLVDARIVRKEAARASGLHAAFAFPIVTGGRLAAVVELFSTVPQRPDADLMETATTVGAQVGAYLERAQAIDALAASEVRKAAILDASLDAIMTIDGRGLVVEWNAAAERMFGWRRAEAVGRLLADLIVPPPLRAAHTEGLRRYMETGVGPVLGRRLEMPAVRASGEQFPAEIAIIPLASQRETLFTGFVRDLTDERRLKAALEASEARYRDLYENVPSMYFALDMDGRIRSVNREGARQLGGTAEELMGRAILDFVHPDDRPLVTAQLEALRAGEEVPGEAELRKLRADGSVIWVRERMRTGREPDGAPSILISCDDITATRESERRAREAAARTVRILESISDAFFAVDRQWRFTYVNAEAERRLGRPRGSLVGRIVWEEFPDARGSPFEKEYTRAMRDRTPVHFEAPYEPLGVWFQVSAYPSPDGLSVFFRDVTEQRRTREEILRLNRDLERLVEQRTHELRSANEELEAFNYLVSHDLKEPVRAVEAYLRALEEDYAEQLTPEAHSLLERAEASTLRLGQLVRGLLELSRAARAHRDDAVPIPPATALRSPECAAQFEGVLAERGARLDVEEVPAVLGTRAALCQIFGNLVLNAVRHNPNPQPRVRVHGRRVKDSVQVMIDDNGPGFPAPILEAFAAGASGGVPAMSRLARGSFGLLIVRRAAERLGGSVELGASPEGGGRVTVTLPAAP